MGLLDWIFGALATIMLVVLLLFLTVQYISELSVLS